MQKLTKIILILTVGLLIGIAVGLPFLHQHSDSLTEPTECLANIVECNLNCSQIVHIAIATVPPSNPHDNIYALESVHISAFEGFLFVNKAPPIV